MTPSRPKRNWFAAVIAPCVLGMLLVPLGQHPVVASSPGADIGARPGAGAVNLRLTPGSATRVMAELSGAAQESDGQNPKSMEAQAAPPPVVPNAAGVKKEAPPPDQFGFLKDWPFWVIVGGVVVAGIGGYMLLHNSNQKAPCAPQFNAGCFP